MFSVEIVICIVVLTLQMVVHPSKRNGLHGKYVTNCETAWPISNWTVVNQLWTYLGVVLIKSNETSTIERNGGRTCEVIHEIGDLVVLSVSSFDVNVNELDYNDCIFIGKDTCCR